MRVVTKGLAFTNYSGEVEMKIFTKENMSK